MKRGEVLQLLRANDVLRHAYHRVSDEVLWTVIKKELPELKVLVTAALHRLED